MDDFYAAVIHDVKNQLAELALRLEKRGDAQPEMDIALDAARRLSEMLMLHREASDLLVVNTDAANPGDMLGILAAEYRALFPEREIEVDATAAPDFVFLDDALVRMALGNALHNACRHARKHVRLRAAMEGEMAMFEIADDGPGFDETQLTSQGRGPEVCKTQGTGLGLYLASRIAALHRLEGRSGRIELLNADGAVFRLLLP